MRSFHIGWQNIRPGFTRRARWYKPTAEAFERGYPIRLNFEDESHSANLYYTTVEEAQADWDDFKADKVSVADLRAKRNV